MEQTEHTYYVILFRGNLGRQDYKALYCHDGASVPSKIHGNNAPETLDSAMIEKYYRYDSGNKIFKELTGVSGFTLTTDAVVMQNKKKGNGLNANILY